MHTLPPITGMLEVGDGASIEPEVDLSGYWIDGDLVRIGSVRVGADATVGTRSTLAPVSNGQRAEIAPGPRCWLACAPISPGRVALRRGAGGTDRDWPDSRPPCRSPGGGPTPPRPSCSPSFPSPRSRSARSSSPRDCAARRPWGRPGRRRFLADPGGTPTLLGFAYAAAVVGLVRLMSIGLREGTHPIRSRIGWQAWTTERRPPPAHHPLPAVPVSSHPSGLRPGAKVGHDVEASTVLLYPCRLRDRRRRLPGGRHDGRLLRVGMAAGCGSARCGSASGAFLGNSVWRRRDTACRGTDSSRSCRRPRSRPSRVHPGSGHPQSGFADNRRKATRVAPTLRLLGCASRGRCGELGRLLPAFVTCGSDSSCCSRSRASSTRSGRSRRSALFRPGHARDQRGGGRHLGRGQVDHRRPDPRGRAAAVVELRLAHRGVRHLHRDGRGPMVRAQRRRNAGAGRVGAGPARTSAVACGATAIRPEPDLVTLGDGSTVNRAASCRPTSSTIGS